jgi:hypothetical protein
MEAEFDDSFLTKADAETSAAALLAEKEAAAKDAAKNAAAAKRTQEANDALKKELENIRTSTMTEQEKLTAEFNKVIAETNAVKDLYNAALSENTLTKVLSGAKINLTNHADTLNMLAGNDPESAMIRGTAIEKMLSEAYAAGEAAANKAINKNNSTLEGGADGGKSGQSAFTMEEIKQMTPAQINENWEKVSASMQEAK